MISASVVLYNTEKSELESILLCLANDSVDIVFLIDNSPDDFLRSFILDRDKIEYHHGHGNIGYGAGHNIAINSIISPKI